MVWARLDDAILDNPKIIAAGVFGFAIHVAAITWCNRNLTDGFIPRAKVRSLLDLSRISVDVHNPLALIDGPSSMAGQDGLDALIVADHLESLGLWKLDEDKGGWWLKDFLEYNPSREKVEAERARKAKGSSKSSSKSSSSVPPPETPRQPPRKIQGSSDGPVPVPVPKERERRAPKPKLEGTPLPDDWTLTPSLLAWAKSKGVIAFDALAAADRFSRHWHTSTKDTAVKRNWDQAYQSWLTRDIADGKVVASPPTVSTPFQPPTPEQLEQRAQSRAMVQAALAQLDANKGAA